MKTSLKLSIGGVTAALSLVLMFLTALIPFGTYAFPCFAGILLIVIVIEAGYAYAFSVFAAVAVLSFLLVTDKEAALMYVIFFGWYPIVKSLIERIGSKVIQYVIKLFVFNACMIGAFFIAVNLLGIPEDSYYIFGFSVPWMFLILGNVYFVFYDICVTKIVTIYLLKWHKKLNKNTKL